jgi:hypothetical protein
MKEDAAGSSADTERTCGDPPGACPALVQQPAADPDLARVVVAWPSLPAAIRAVILAAVDAAPGR